MTVFEATDAGQTHAMACFLTVEERVYAHHLGVTEEGRAKNIIHGMYAFALDHFSGRARYLDFGSNTGITDNPDDGLSRFKQGWCSETRRSFVGGKILNTDLYHRLCRDRGVRQSAYFPAYRTPAAANTG
jgi:hypothetical protein